MSKLHPDAGTVRAALALAVRAPSVHNTQPWEWRVGDTTVQLYADESRQLAHTDPDRRDLVLSCGAALHHLRVAARGFGWETVVRRMPNPAEPRHLASVEFRAGAATDAGVRLVRAITERRSDRRRFTSWPLSGAHVQAVIDAGVAEGGVQIRDLDDEGMRARLLRAFEAAARQHAADPSYQSETALWSGAHAATQGVPARNTVVATEPTTRVFANPELHEAVVHDTDGADRLLLVVTSSDDDVARLRAGEAASAMLLTATTLGLAVCPLTEPFEVAQVRERVRREVLGEFGYPQVLIRMGWASSSAPQIPATPRRPLEEVVRSL